MNFDGDLVRVDIGDTTVELIPDTEPQIIQLQPSGDPLHIAVVNSDEDKFTSIRAKQAVIEFLSDASYNAATFADGSDNRYSVTITLNPTATPVTIFLGFLVLADISQPWQPYPQVVTLTASDHLGLLKDIALTDQDGNYMRGKFKISTFIANALFKTGLSLDVKVMNNLRVGGGEYDSDATFVASTNYFITPITKFFYVGQRIRISNTVSNDGDYTVLAAGVGVIAITIVDGTITDEVAVDVHFEDLSSSSHLYDTVYLDALTFEQSISVGESCYRVLEKILGDDCFLTQYQGKWWIIRVDEMDQYGSYVATFDADTGSFNDIGFVDIGKYIGNIYSHFWVRADQITRYDRGMGYIKETFNFTYPAELVCNIDFSRGVTVIDAPDLGAANSTGTYEVECWTVRRIFGSPVTSTIHIERTFEYGYEKQKYLVITPATGTSTPFDFAESEPFDVFIGDRVEFSVDWRFETDFGAGEGAVTYFPAMVYILAANGDRYYWWNPDTSNDLSTFYWYKRLAVDGEGNFYMPVGVNLDDEDQAAWQTLSANLGDIPVDGKFYVCLLQLHQGADAGDDQDAFYQNLNIVYNPKIAGSYQLYTSQSHKVSRTDTGYLAKRENEVFMSDAPRPAFKGGMFILSGSDYALIAAFYSSAQFSLGFPTSEDFVNRYGYHQAFAVWNQYRNTIRKFTGTVIGLRSDWVDVIHKVNLADNTDDTNGRIFMLLSFNQNWKTCETSSTFMEVYNYYTGKTFTDPWEFKYLNR